ncbi:hypothetical protein [Streptomyces sp. URMC 129]|uniref:hypothetical protein n=1 Tax=Streptomyces sp. URMC 129 TaxID=3423407 RepID=UPI003F198C4F
MSGGSYNYLYCHVGGLEAQSGDIEAMAKRLEEMDFPGRHIAAEHTRLILSLFAAAEALGQRLSDVWHAVEWRDSGDVGDDEVRHALEKYRDEAR